MKWRKASERLPEVGGLKFARMEGYLMAMIQLSIRTGKIHLSGCTKPIDYDYSLIEWLDETPEPTRQGAEAPFPDRMTFKEMLSNLFDVSFLTGEELETISKAGEMYANGCLKAQSFSAQSEGEIERLKGLVEQAFKKAYELARYAREIGDEGYYQEQCFATFKTNNNL